MTDQMKRQLRQAEETYRSLEASLAAPAVASDPARCAQVMKEYKSLTPLIEAYRSCLAAENDAEQALRILNENPDAELHELANHELKEAHDRIDRLTERMTLLLFGQSFLFCL